MKEGTEYGVRLYLKPKARGTPVVQARLGSAVGPILAEQEIDAFAVDYSALMSIVVNNDTDMAHASMTMKPWIPDIDVNCAMFASYSTFAGGATEYSLNTSDFSAQNVNGDPAVELVVDPATGETQAVLRVDFEIPPDEDSYCFQAVFDQHSKYGSDVGKSVHNGNGCRFDVLEEACIMIKTKGSVNVWVNNPENHDELHKENQPGHGFKLIKHDDPDITIATTPADFNCKTEAGTITSFPLTFTANDKCGWYDVKIEDTKFEKKVLLFDLKLVTPRGNAANDHIVAGDGQNHYVYDDAQAGKFTINFKASFEPKAEIQHCKDHVTFAVAPINGFAWGQDYDNGKAKINGDFFIAEATCTGLPHNNNDFGDKQAEVRHKNVAVDTAVMRVFFTGTAKNNPDGTVPNWFYYWKQFVPDMGDFIYDDNLGALGQYDRIADKLYLGKDTWQSKSKRNAIWYRDSEKTFHPQHTVGVDAKGLDCTFAIVKHELKHKTNWETCKNGVLPDKDLDQDGLLKSQESAQGTIDRDNDDAHLDETDCWLMQSYGNYKSYGDDEYSASRAESTDVSLHKKDWMAGEYGKQW